MRTFIPIAMTAVVALGLGACAKADDTADTTPVQSEPMDQPTDMASNDMTLSVDQQARRDAMSMDDLDSDVQGYYADTSDWPATGADWTMTSLDWNHDGKVSPSEFAVYDIESTRNGARPSAAPYYTDAQLGTAADHFAYFDNNGDGYLSNAEFTTAMSSMASGDQMASDPMGADAMGSGSMNSDMNSDRPSN